MPQVLGPVIIEPFTTQSPQALRLIAIPVGLSTRRSFSMILLELSSRTAARCVPDAAPASALLTRMSCTTQLSQVSRTIGERLVLLPARLPLIRKSESMTFVRLVAYRRLASVESGRFRIVARPCPCSEVLESGVMTAEISNVPSLKIGRAH